MITSLHCDECGLRDSLSFQLGDVRQHGIHQRTHSIRRQRQRGRICAGRGVRLHGVKMVIKMVIKMMIQLMNKVISLRISNVRSAVEGLQSAVDLKKVTSSIDGLKKLSD